MAKAYGNEDCPVKGTILLQDIPVLIVPKRIQHMYLSVYPPKGDVRLSVPAGIGEERVKAFLRSKIDWIRRQRLKILDAASCGNLAELENKVRVWGKAHELRIYPNSSANLVSCAGESVHVYMRGENDGEKARQILQLWHKSLVSERAMPLLEEWRKVLKLPPVVLAVRQMKSRWGSCIPQKRRVALNSVLAQRPPECLNCVIVHELLHFFVLNHGPEFRALMDRHVPDWRRIDEMLKKPQP